MTERIHQIHQKSRESYGMPRVRAELIEDGGRMTADLVLAALNMALEQRKPQCVIHHSDQGSQRPPAWPLVSDAGRCRFGPLWARWTDACDSAMAESFFAGLEGEPIGRKSFQSKAQARRRSSHGLKTGTAPGAATAAWVTSHP